MHFMDSDDGIERQNLKTFSVVVCPVSNTSFCAESWLTNSRHIFNSHMVY